ncbi:MSCRAMM family protein [Halanaerobacter jeridensis]|uniref:PEGA domain-containing protein n=1 Tax=Halanaerobacter jeridensis TaxID=706427 RepID=A0A938XTG4_9FIRM|nr:carboxypeptidase-like regulatory domain-containing protein [Halanaerobacter jeridensis]MBM7557431.1 hypothetical protein [Halanaerobacter jeridensis]
MRQNNTKMLVMTILLTSLLLLVGCNQDLGNLRVEVKDEAGQNLNATITASRGGQTREKESSNGVAQFKDIPTGTYKLNVSKEGYQAITESVTLEGKNLSYEVTLKEKTYNLKLNVTNQSGENLTATAKLEGTTATHTKTITDGSATIEGLKAGDYQLSVTKDGYQSATKNITITDQNLRTSLKLAKVKSETAEQKQQQKKVDLNVKVADINENPLPATVQIKANGSVVEEKTAAQTSFKDLDSGNYTVTIKHPSYENWTKEVNLKSNTNLNAVLKGGPIGHNIFSAKQGSQTVQLSSLADNEELIVALTKLNWKQINEENIYEPRRKENQLVKEHGTNFANAERNYQVGDTKEFKLPEKVCKKGTISAELAKAGEHIYVFVGEDSYVKESDLNDLVTEFDNNIFPSLTNKKNINGKITVLLSQFTDYQMTGYFDAADLYPELGNEEPMFYINARRSGNTLLTSAAHQYQHLNFFVDKAKAGRVANDAWINQGLSQLAPQLLGYIGPASEGWSPEKGNGWVYDQDFGYLNNTSEVNLLVHDGSLPFTGAAGLFTNYLADHFGTELIYKLVTSSKGPREVIADHTGTNFNHIYLNWVTTNVTDSIEEIDNPIYNYSQFDLAKMPKLATEEASNYGVNYFKVDQSEFSIYPPEGYEGKIGVVIIKHQK